MPPKIVVEGGRLFVAARGGRYLPVSRVVSHGIFEHDLDFLAGLSL